MLRKIVGLELVGRNWNRNGVVPRVFIGIGKDFTVYKNIKGNTGVFYILYCKDDMSRYGDLLAVRDGFDFPMKK